jgi:hypothetical protein
LNNDELEFDSEINDSKEKIIQHETSYGSSSSDISKIEKNNKLEKIILLSIIFCVSFICYGILPGLQSYSTLPYGNDVFNYSVNLSKLKNKNYNILFLKSIIF